MIGKSAACAAAKTVCTDGVSFVFLFLDAAFHPLEEALFLLRSV